MKSRGDISTGFRNSVVRELASLVKPTLSALYVDNEPFIVHDETPLFTQFEQQRREQPIHH
jgi:hypothetical protein